MTIKKDQFVASGFSRFPSQTEFMPYEPELGQGGYPIPRSHEFTVQGAAPADYNETGRPITTRGAWGWAGGSIYDNAEPLRRTGVRAGEIAEAEYARAGGLRGEYDPRFTHAADISLRGAHANLDRADEQWAHYRETFQPIERRVAQDALTYDSPAEIARRENLAAATVGNQFGLQRGQIERQAAATGMGAGRMTALMRDFGAQEALAKAGAVNTARNSATDAGISLRQSAMQAGRNLPATSIAASGASTSGAQGTAGIAGSHFGANTHAMAPTQSMMATGITGHGTGGQLAATHWGQHSAHQQNAARLDAAEQQGRGQAIGSAVGTGLGLYALSLSDRKKKKNIRPVRDEQVLEAMRETPVSTWQYKGDLDDGQVRMGPMAQDVHQSMGDAVAPGGKAIDLVSMLGAQQAAIRAIDKKLQHLIGDGAISMRERRRPTMEELMPTSEASRRWAESEGDAGMSLRSLPL